jgi:hypothetical protein
MKVIEKGRKQKGWARKFKCTGAGNGGGGCNAKLLVEQDDVYLTHSYHYDGSHEVYNTFKCPECGVETDIPSVPFTPKDKKGRNENNQ